MPSLARERMPLTDLCNRLVVTSTRWDTPLPSLRLSPFRPLQPASPFRSSLRPSFQDATVHSDVDEPLPAFSTLGRDTVDAVSPAAVRLTAPEGHSVSRAAACRGIFRPMRARSADLQAPPVASSSLLWHPRVGPRKPGPSSRAARQGCTRCEGPRRLPPTGPVDLAPSLRSERDLPGRHWCSGFATGTQRPTCFHTRLRRALDPKPEPAFAGVPRATCRLPTSAAVRPPSTPAIRPNHVARCGGEPPRGV
jgi:hypothetical protein